MLEGLELRSTCHLEPSLPAGSHSPLREAWLLRTVSDGALTPKDGWVSSFQNIDLCSILSMSWTGPVQGSGSEMFMDYFRWNVFLWLCVLLGTFNTLATWCEELSHWKRPWCWERLKAGGEGDDRGWGGWVASPTQWTWVWASSRSWWRTGRPGVLQSMGSQRVGHDWAAELNWNLPAAFLSSTRYGFASPFFCSRTPLAMSSLDPTKSPRTVCFFMFWYLPNLAAH